VLAEDAAGNLSGWGPDATGLLATTAAAFSFTDPTFDAEVLVIIDDGAGGKYVGGGWTSVTCNVTATTYTTGYTRLVHLLPTGEVDAAWSCPAVAQVTSLILDVDSDRLYVGGGFNGASSLGGATRDFLAVVTASTGVVDAGWVCNASGDRVEALALDVAGDVLYVGGGFNGASGLGGVARNYLGAVTASTGVVDAGWVCDGSGRVRALALDVAGDRLYVGGNFTTLDAATRTKLAAVTASTGDVVVAWTADCGALPNAVYALAIDATGDRLYVGGLFTALDGAAKTNLAAVTASSGNVVTGWTCNAATFVYSVVVDAANDRLYVGGNFSGATGFDGAARDRCAAATASTGDVVAGWVCNASVAVFAFLPDVANDALFVGGYFNGATGLDGAQRDRFGTVVASTGDLFVP
jgi:hypothetical protein